MMTCSPAPNQRFVEGRRSWLRRTAALFAQLGGGWAGGCTLGGVGNGGPAPASYSAAMRQAIGSVAGPLPGYLFRTTPVGNFGVGSIYVDDIAGSDLAQVESSWFLGGPDTWLASTQAATERQRRIARMISEGTMGALHLEGSGAREIQAQVGIALVTALGGSASLDAQRGVETRLQADEVRQRRLNWAEFQAALRAGLIDREVSALVTRGRFVLVAADVVLVGYRAEISIDESRAPALAVNLRTKALLPAVARGSANLRVAEATRGRFVVTSQQPVVAAVLFKRPPPTPKDGSSPSDPDAWPAANVSESIAATVESQVIKARESR